MWKNFSDKILKEICVKNPGLDWGLDPTALG
jgi:hypothetical protein